MPTKMRAIAMTKSLPTTDPDALVEMQLPTPTPGPDDLVVRVKAVSVNPVDVKIREGAGDQDEPKVLGWDAAGIVEQVGEKVAGIAVGDEVFYSGDLTRPGTNSEFHAVDYRMVGRKPTQLTFAEAAALPLTAITAWETLFDHMQLTSESRGTLLVIGGAGGVGSLVIQLAKQFTNLTVLATASRPESVAWCERMGADAVLDHSQNLAPQVEKFGGADYVFSAYTAGREEDIAECMNPHGNLVLIDDPETFNIGAFKSRSITVTPEFMFTRSMFKTPDMGYQGELLDKVGAALTEGKLASTMTAQLEGFTPQTLLAAHQLVETGHVIGKITVNF